MAMNKTEKAALDGAFKALAEARALSWSQLTSPKFLDREAGGKPIDAWTFNLHTREVRPVAITGSFHYGYTVAEVKALGARATGSYAPNGPLYATRLDAAVGLRLAMEQQAAKHLAAVDAMIAEARGE